MKNSLLALALLGVFASAAQAQVTVGGVVQADIKNYKVGNTTRPAKNEIRIDDDYTSRFWLSGSEDLNPERLTRTLLWLPANQRPFQHWDSSLYSDFMKMPRQS